MSAGTLAAVPELPEVETIVRGLTPALRGRRIDAVTVRETRLRTRLAPGFATQLCTRRIEGLRRHGKFILASLDDGRVWLVHLGMTGRLTVAPPGRPDRPHDHVVLRLDDGQLVTYNDIRRFGRMAVIDAAALRRETVRGVDALSPALTPEMLFALSRPRRTSIKALLMDQQCVAGLGNIYVNEILHRVGIRPRRRAGRLTRAECRKLVTTVRAVLGEAIARGGSSISDYRDGFGRPGSYQRLHRVYGRAGEPCRRCATPIRACVVAGRASFYCPRCQR